MQYIVAPYEADAQMTFLAVSKQVEAVITEDSDLIPFGCPRVSDQNLIKFKLHISISSVLLLMYISSNLLMFNFNFLCSFSLEN